MPPAILQVHCSCPDADTARRLARGAVESRLAACAQVLPGVAACYRWEGRVEEASEALLLLKTRADRLAELQAWLVQAHPYELPEIVAVDIAAGLPGYLAWVADETAAV